mgnify:CR=1 FL=1
MKKKSFLLSFFLAMLFVVLGSVNVKADETLEGYTYVNPMYEDLEGNFDFESDFELYSESDSEESDEEDGIDTYDSRSVQYTSDKQSLIKTFRQQLVNRAETIDLYYHCDQKITQDFFDEFSAELFNGAVAHTGVGKEGDYIRWHYQGWRVNANYKTDRNGGYNLNITYNMYYLSDASQESQMDQAVSNVLKSLNLSNKTDYQKIKAIYDYICSNITYDYVNLNDDSYLLKHTAYAALINKTAVCQGYATLFYRLSLESGVDTRVITGDSGGPHAWNIVKLNGKYYNLDSTWDAGSSSYYYFLKSMNDFSNHTRYEEYQTSDFTSAYPMAEKSYSESGNQEPLEKEHNYGQPMYVWANDHKSITAARICQNDSSHIEQETAEAEQTVIKEPTCTEKGSVLWRAVFENPAFEAQEEVVEEPALGHSFKNGVCVRCNAKITGRWMKSGSKWWYRYEDGSYPKNGLYKIGNTWYGFDASGWMKTGWAAFDKNWYYFAPSGAMKTGWQYLSNTWYYCENSGRMVSDSWYWVGNYCYYFKDSGGMAANTWIGDWYVDGSGAWIPGMTKPKNEWIYQSGRWWYRHADGSYTRDGWERIGNTQYYFDGSGWMITGWKYSEGIWYYMNDSGAMISNCWYWIGTNCYYFNENGEMAADAWIGDWYVDGNGAWIPKKVYDK